MPIEQNIPTNYEAEEGIIACLFFNWRNIVKIADRLRPAHFHDDKLATIYSCILDLYQRGQRPTIPSVADEWARRTVQPLEIRQMSWELEQFTTSMATLHGVDAYVESVIRVSQHRRLIQACQRIVESAYHQDENSLQLAEEAITAIALDGDLKGLTLFGTALDAYLAHYERMRTEVREGKSIGVKTGLKTVDALLGGFRPGTLSILAARTSIGKTSLALNIALTIAKQAIAGGGEVAFFSLEMQQDELVQRLLAMDVPIDQALLHDGRTTEEEHLQSPVEIGLFGYPWCERFYMRCFILQWASENGYPDLHYDTGKMKYMSGEGLFNWLVTVLVGTDDFVWSVLLAIENYEHSSQ